MRSRAHLRLQPVHRSRPLPRSQLRRRRARCDSPQTLRLRLTNFGIHETQLVGVDLVSADHILRSRALLERLSDGKPTADIVMPLAIDANEVPAKGEQHPLHLEIFGDANEDGQYTLEPVAGKQDHDWIVSCRPTRT